MAVAHKRGCLAVDEYVNPGVFTRGEKTTSIDSSIAGPSATSLKATYKLKSLRWLPSASRARSASPVRYFSQARSGTFCLSGGFCARSVSRPDPSLLSLSGPLSLLVVLLVMGLEQSVQGRVWLGFGYWPLVVIVYRNCRSAGIYQ